MTLSYGMTSPQDMLAKAQRDLSRLEAAETAQDHKQMSDSLFDLAVSLTSLKDWLKEHPGASFSSSNVEAHVADSIALTAFRDIANDGKHRVIRKYTPQTMNVSASATDSFQVIAIAGDDSGASEQAKLFYRLKVIRTDRSRHRATNLGHDAIREWQTFMKAHELVV